MDQVPTEDSKPAIHHPAVEPADGFAIWAWVLGTASIILIIWGLIETYSDTHNNRLDVEDLVKATRGIGILCIGLILAVVGALCALFSIRYLLKHRARREPLNDIGRSSAGGGE